RIAVVVVVLGFLGGAGAGNAGLAPGGKVLAVGDAPDQAGGKGEQPRGGGEEEQRDQNRHEAFGPSAQGKGGEAGKAGARETAQPKGQRPRLGHGEAGKERGGEGAADDPGE